ncbi:hypothetical protein FRC02_007604 [Tulasnella sp. 418]|nr:hypothetical protein FRC02_007604 [Tulasnella sp. 418]
MSNHVDSSYIALLKDHITHVKSHREGVDDDLVGPSELPASKVDSYSYWTAREKRLLFYGLSRHSRLRPDLISELIGSKSLVDVCTYIQLLDKQAKAHPHSINRVECPAAREMVPTWERFEEKQASSLLSIQRKRRRQDSNDDQAKMNKRPRLAIELLPRHITSVEAALRNIAKARQNDDASDVDGSDGTTTSRHKLSDEHMSDLDEIQVTSSMLHEDGIAMLRLAKAQKLMRFYFKYCRLARLQNPAKHKLPLPSLTYGLLVALVQLLRQFLRGVIAHTISCAESQLNSRVPVYLFGNGGLITPAHVESAVSAMNLETSKSRFFEDMVDRLGAFLEQKIGSMDEAEPHIDPLPWPESFSDTQGSMFPFEAVSPNNSSSLVSFPDCLYSSTSEAAENLDDEAEWARVIKEEEKIDGQDSILDAEEQEEAWNSCSSQLRKKQFLSNSLIIEEDEDRKELEEADPSWNEEDDVMHSDSNGE